MKRPGKGDVQHIGRVHPVTKSRSRYLRSSATDAERHLWYRIRHRQLDGFKFRRQHPVGNYIVDFICLEAALIVEVDGGQHGVQIVYDAERTRTLRSLGFDVLRFWNNEVLMEIESVLEAIWQHLHSEQPPSRPSP